MKIRKPCKTLMVEFVYGAEEFLSYVANIARDTTDPGNWVHNFQPEWCQIDFSQNQMALILLVENMTTRWRYLHWLQSWPPDSATCIANTVYWFQSWLPGCIICIVTLPFCLGLPYWHHQLVLSCNSHQPESHQLSQHLVCYWQTDIRTRKPDPRDTWVR